MSTSTRRSFLGLVSASAAGILQPGSAQAAAKPSNDESACILTPQAEEGPFYADPKLVRQEITEGKPGVPLTLRLRVIEAGPCTAITGARIDIWHCDAQGLYSAFPGQSDRHNVDTSGKTFLRGTQTTDDTGWVTFNTIYPGWYDGRTAHIHFKVFLGGGKVATSQLFFPDALNQFVYENVSPYTDRAAGRDTVNATDGDARDGGDAAFCYVKEEADRYLAGLVIGISRLSPVKPQGPGGLPPGGPPPGGPPAGDESTPSAPPAINKAQLVPGGT